MMTKWAGQLDKDNVLMEYPRPQMCRSSYINLNGLWSYAIVRGKGIPDKPDGEILVPFSPECALSGVMRKVTPEDTLWYMRSFILPEDFNIGRVLLHFGAVDYSCRVYVNGSFIGSHEGGHVSVEFDITHALISGEENTVELCARDDYSDMEMPRGKQFWERESRSIFYSRTTGIWQTVWLEAVPNQHIKSCMITPLLDERAVRF